MLICPQTVGTLTVKLAERLSKLTDSHIQLARRLCVHAQRLSIHAQRLSIHAQRLSIHAQRLVLLGDEAFRKVIEEDNQSFCNLQRNLEVHNQFKNWLWTSLILYKEKSKL